MTTEKPTAAPVPMWAIVELMGHVQLAGQVCQDSTLAPGLVRLDVPEVDGREAFTKYIAPAALYSITPTTEATARAAARTLQARPLECWGLERELARAMQAAAERPSLMPPGHPSDDPNPTDDPDLGLDPDEIV